MMMAMVVPPHIPLCGIGGGNQREGVCFKLSGSLHRYRAHLTSGGMARLGGLLFMSTKLMLLSGPFQLVCWCRCVSFLIFYIGLLLLMTWGREGGLTPLVSSCLFSMIAGLVRGCFWSRPFEEPGGVGVQFRCRLFLLDRASIFGVLAGFWVLC